VHGLDGRSARWSWDEFQALPREMPTVDIHCVTKWSRLDTTWEGMSVDTLLDVARTAGAAVGDFVVAFCDGGYTTNLRLADVTGGRAWIAFGYDGAPLGASSATGATRDRRQRRSCP
jgi:DMSO/TMAO reductase YedYZ molybdopterin-dependent catalytic subunit